MPKRSLILAGGGLKVGFQAGVLQVWLDEAGITFDHADGASGGCLNLAMYCQGMTGTQIANNWRDYDPFLPNELNFEAPGQFAHQQSYFTLDQFRAKLLPKWGINWPKIRAGTRVGTFNLCNFSKKRLEVVTNAEMDEDRLISSISLPMWFPPIKINGDTYIDAVYLSDANVEEAIRRGADEIWAIWTVSTRDEWRPGFVEQYFQIIETVADGNFFATWRRIEQNNADIAAGKPGEFGRTIKQRLLQQEVPLHYLFNFSRDRMAEAVNFGVDTARAWLKDQNIPFTATPTPQKPAGQKTSLEFTEEMKGFLGAGATDFKAGQAAGRTADTKLNVKLTIHTDDADAFLTDAKHATGVTGTADSPLLGGKVPVQSGVFNLLINAADQRKKEMRYRLVVNHTDGTPRTIVGVKHIQNDGGIPDIWGQTTTLYTTLYRGKVDEGQDATAEKLAVGIIQILFFDFLVEMTTFKVEGGTLAARTAVLARFTELFLGRLAEAYGGFLTTT